MQKMNFRGYPILHRLIENTVLLIQIYTSKVIDENQRKYASHGKEMCL